MGKASRLRRTASASNRLVACYDLAVRLLGVLSSHKTRDKSVRSALVMRLACQPNAPAWMVEPPIVDDTWTSAGAAPEASTPWDGRRLATYKRS